MVDGKRKHEHNEWAKLAQNLKEKKAKKRQGGKCIAGEETKHNEVGSSILSSKELVVQQLDGEPSGVAMKYKKIGPQEFVEFDFEAVTICM